MATVYRRNGYLREAEALYLQGLQVDDRDLTIISNLSGLYRQLNEPEKAEAFFRLAERHRNGNPYFLYYEANKSLEAGDAEHARDLLKKAISKEKHEVRFYDLGVKIYEALGDPKQAEAMRARAAQRREAIASPS